MIKIEDEGRQLQNRDHHYWLPGGAFSVELVAKTSTCGKGSATGNLLRSMGVDTDGKRVSIVERCSTGAKAHEYGSFHFSPDHVRRNRVLVWKMLYYISSR